MIYVYFAIPLVLYFISWLIFGRKKVNVFLVYLAIGVAFVFSINSYRRTPYLIRHNIFDSIYLNILAWLGIIIGLVGIGKIIFYLFKLTIRPLKYVLLLMLDLAKSLLLLIWLLHNRESKSFYLFDSISSLSIQKIVIKVMMALNLEDALQNIAQKSLSWRIEIAQIAAPAYEGFCGFLQSIKNHLEDVEVFHQIFCYCDKSHRLYLILYGLGFSEDTDVSEALSKLCETYIPYTQDAKMIGIKEIHTRTEFWDGALLSKTRRDFTLAYILNRTRFNKLKSSLTVADYPANTIRRIKEEYSLKKLDARDKTQVEKLLEREKNEIKKVYDASLFNNCKEFIGDINPVRFYIVYNDSEFEKTKRIDLSSVHDENIVSFDFQKDSDKIRDDLKEQLASLKDSDSIMKAKKIAENSINKQIDWRRLGYTLETIKTHTIDFDNTKAVVNLALRSKNYHLIKAALLYMSESNDPRWIDLLPIYSRPSSLNLMTIEALSNKASINALVYISYIESLHSWQRVLEGDFSNAQFSEDGRLAYANSNIYKLHDWIKWFQVDNFVSFSVGAGIIISRSKIYFIDSHELDSVPNRLNALSISPNYKWWATQNSILASKKKLKHHLNLPQTDVAVFSPDSKWFSNGEELIWISKKRRWDYKGKTPCFSQDGNWYADSERLVYLKPKKKKKHYYLYQELREVGSKIGFSNDSKWYGCDKRLYLIDSDVTETLTYHDLPNLFQCFSHDSLYVATTNEIIWLETMETVAKFNAQNARFSPDGYFIACSDGLYLTHKHQLLLTEIAMNSLISIKENLKNIDIKDLLKIRKNISKNDTLQFMAKEIDNLIEQQGAQGSEISIDKDNKDDSTDIIIGG